MKSTKLSRTSAVSVLVLALVAFGIALPATSTYAQSSTPTSTPAYYVPPTVTNFPTQYSGVDLFPTSSGINLTPDYMGQCPYQGTPVGYGTVTPDPLWLMMCARCMPSPTAWPTISFPTGTPAPVGTGTPATPTSTATSTATSTPSGNPCGVIDDNAILANMWGQASPMGSYYDGQYTGWGNADPVNQWALTTSFYPGQSQTVHYFVTYLGGSVTFTDNYWNSHCINSKTIDYQNAITCGLLAPVAVINGSGCVYAYGTTFDCRIEPLGAMYLRFHLGGTKPNIATWSNVHVQIARSTDCMLPNGTPTPSGDIECSAINSGVGETDLAIPSLFTISPVAECFSTPWISIYDTSPILIFMNSVLDFMNIHTEFFDNPSSWIYTALQSQTFCFRTIEFASVQLWGVEITLSLFFIPPIFLFILNHLVSK